MTRATDGRARPGAFALALTLVACADPAPGTPRCAAGEVADAAGACLPEACGSDPWPAAEGPLVHVDASRTGDGTADAPFARVQDGLDAAAALGGATVLVAAGTYAETLVLGSDHDGVRLRARCAELVTIDGSLATARPVLTVSTTQRRRPAVEIAGLTLTGGTDGGVRVADADLALRDVVVRDNDALGILATGADLTLQDVDVLGTRATRTEQGVALGGQAGSTLTVRGGEVAGNASAGIYADGSTVDLADVAIHDNGNIGLGAVSGSSLTGRGLSLVRNVAMGAYASASSLDLTDTRIDDVVADADGNFGYGVGAATRAQVSLTDVEVAQATAAALMTLDGRATITATRANLHDTRLSVDGTGHGVGVADGGTVTLRDSRIADGWGGVYVVGADSSIELVDSTVAGSRTQGTPGTGGHPTGQGILARSGPTVRVERCAFEDNDNGGIVASGGAVEVLDSTFLGNRGSGLYVSSIAGRETEGTSLVVERTRIEGTQGSDAGLYGRGIEVFASVDATLREVQILDNAEVGAYFADQVDATLVNVEVRGTRRSRSHAMASGLVVGDSSRVTCRRCTLADNEGPGAYMGMAGTLDLVGAEVTGNRFAGLALIGDGWMNATESTITGTLPDESVGGGFGVYAMAVAARDGTWAEEGIVFLTDSEVGPHPYAAVWLDGPGEYQLRGNTLQGSEGFVLGSWPVHGNALFATNGIEPWSGFTGLLIEGNTFRGAADVAMLLHGATGRFGEGNVFRNNGVDLIQQRCIETDPIRQVPIDIEADVCPYRARLVDRNARFRSIAIPEATVLE